jgi:hypothetical protein
MWRNSDSHRSQFGGGYSIFDKCVLVLDLSQQRICRWTQLLGQRLGEKFIQSVLVCNCVSNLSTSESLVSARYVILGLCMHADLVNLLAIGTK